VRLQTPDLLVKDVEMVVNIKKWLLFFGPTRFVSCIKDTDSIFNPILVICLISILNFKIYNILHKVSGLEELETNITDIIVVPLAPFILAAIYHSLARVLVGARDSIGRLVRLFYYSYTGYELCYLLLGVLFLFLPVNRMLYLTGGLYVLYSYSLFVSVYLIKENYTISFREALLITLLILPLVGISFLITFSIWRLID
jgi:hypothetical protein